MQLDDPLKLEFVANKYGPYADRLRHLLNGLDGSYLHCEKRLSDAGPFNLIWFEDTKRRRVEAFLQKPEMAQYVPALEKTSALIDGFESPLGVELLATVDWLAVNGYRPLTPESLRTALGKWPGGVAAARRKKKLFDKRLLALALDRLRTWAPAVSP